MLCRLKNKDRISVRFQYNTSLSYHVFTGNMCIYLNNSTISRNPKQTNTQMKEMGVDDRMTARGLFKFILTSSWGIRTCVKPLKSRRITNRSCLFQAEKTLLEHNYAWGLEGVNPGSAGALTLWRASLSHNQVEWKQLQVSSGHISDVMLAVDTNRWCTHEVKHFACT